ncbi:hypothetical protein BDV41DRAFT_578883 [Aspergillus transmontanensis]|uniref:Uncharacterized protein n=1 Tax=Aspergillus transmontanensis TaxID=1034304 RepID=A0A5N6VSC0_9EURO|nr:hypothetical protein BDV41DRAFT_578883 [Aspergillus transmontanensis]
MVSNKLYNTVMEGSDPAGVTYSLETIKGLLQEFKAMDDDNDGKQPDTFNGFDRIGH